MSRFIAPMLISFVIVLGTITSRAMEKSIAEGDLCHNRSYMAAIIASPLLPRLSAVEGDTIRILPGQPLFLEPNIPNPFQGKTTIAYTLDRETRVTLRVFDAFYNEIAILVDNDLQAEGRYEETFDSEENLASGMYFYSLATSAGVETRRMLLVK